MPWTVDAVNALLYRHDPIGLVLCGCPEDEYKPEAALIVELDERDYQTVDTLTRAVHRIFVRMFDHITAGRRRSYRPIAEELMLFPR